jgi:hypothetical protein
MSPSPSALQCAKVWSRNSRDEIQAAKSSTSRKAEVIAEMRVVINEVTRDCVRYDELVKRMALVAYHDDEDSDSSCDEEEDMLVTVDAKEGGMGVMLALEEGSVSVCTGKACTRKGNSLVLVDEIKQRMAGRDVTITSCKCMGICKSAANVELCDRKGARTRVTGLSADSLPGQIGARKDVLASCSSL